MAPNIPYSKYIYVFTIKIVIMKIGTDESGNLLNEVSNRLNDNTRRIRVLEGRLRNVDTRVNKAEQSEILDKNQAVKEVRNMQDDLRLVQDRIANLEVDIQTVHREIKKSVAHTELKEIQNYIELINPILTKFVTKKEVEEMIGNKIAGNQALKN